jgi:hypothetical protein
MKRQMYTNNLDKIWANGAAVSISAINRQGLLSLFSFFF